ncbi:MAG: hypothetical protein D6744_05070, partial [Planctomycetota bacterium]
MKRVASTIILAAALGLSAPQHAHAQTARQIVVAQLQDQGYYNITVQRTFLGRLRFKAENDVYVREIVINPVTGLILRDYSRRKDGEDGIAGIRLQNPAGSGEGAAQPGDPGDDPSDDDEGDDEPDDE